VPECPRCHQPVDSQAIACPHCRMTLKAYGHPGISLFRATGNESLCDTCLYHEDDSCNFPQRPHAKECTLYTDRTKPIVHAPPSGYTKAIYHSWFKRNLAWLVLAGIVVFSFVLTILR
jgi:hypothetical protein